MSDKQEKALEFKVGLFVLFGLALLLSMIIHFGRLGEGLQSYYEIRVEFPNASGLLKGSNVLYGGAQIGRVSDHPRITNAPEVLDETTGVVVTLKIFNNIEMPKESSFVVGSSGLLGDRFVDVVPPEKFTTEEKIKPGSLLAGTRVAGIDDITREGTELIKDLRNTVTNIDNAVARVDQELLKKSNMEAFESTMQNMKKTTGQFAETGDKLDAVVASAQGFMKNAESAMEKGEDAMQSGQLAAEEIRGVIKNADATISSTKKLIEQGLNGQGILGRIISDPAMSNDLEALLANLRKHGVLFYKDSAGKTEESSGATSLSPNAPPTRSGTRRR